MDIIKGKERKLFGKFLVVVMVTRGKSWTDKENNDEYWREKNREAL